MNSTKRYYLVSGFSSDFLLLTETFFVKKQESNFFVFDEPTENADEKKGQRQERNNIRRLSVRTGSDTTFPRRVMPIAAQIRRQSRTPGGSRHDANNV